MPGPPDMSTVNEGDWLRGRGFATGKGGDDAITIGWYDQGGGENGHTAGEFPDGTQFESHGPRRPRGYGTGQGIDQSIFTDFAHLQGQRPGSRRRQQGRQGHQPRRVAQPQQHGPERRPRRTTEVRDPRTAVPSLTTGIRRRSLRAGLAAKGIVEGQTRMRSASLGIPDSPNFLSAFSELNKQVRIYDQKSNKTLFGGYDGKDEKRKKQKLFDSGGWLEPGVTMARNLTGKREAVLTNEQWATAERALAALPPMRSVPTRPDLVGAAAGGRDGDQVTWNISTARVEDAFTQARQREERRAAGRSADGDEG